MASEIDYARIDNTLGKFAAYLEQHKSVCVSVSGGQIVQL